MDTGSVSGLKNLILKILDDPKHIMVEKLWYCTVKQDFQYQQNRY